MQIKSSGLVNVMVISGRLTFNKLFDFANSHGIRVEKKGRQVVWFSKDDHSIVGVCDTIKEALYEIVDATTYGYQIVFDKDFTYLDSSEILNDSSH
jgi:hypothetical protein